MYLTELRELANYYEFGVQKISLIRDHIADKSQQERLLSILNIKLNDPKLLKPAGPKKSKSEHQT